MRRIIILQGGNVDQVETSITADALPIPGEDYNPSPEKEMGGVYGSG
jgi:hypothetical protein